MTDDVVAIEQAMVAIRRLQQRRTLAKLSAHRSGRPVDPTLTAVVDAVEHHPDSTVSTVAAALDVDQPRASRLVARAVDAGLLTRTADPTDGRRTLLRLTKAGTTHAAHVHRQRQTLFTQAMSDWTPHQITTFARLLTRFTTAYSTLVHSHPTYPQPHQS
jgi:DNA-binding MarR family transcriptional regulator